MNYKWLILLLSSILITGCTFGDIEFSGSQSGLPKWKSTTTDEFGVTIGNSIVPRSDKGVYVYRC